jgi:uncharacterized protein YbjT (DUF2867 family)
MTLPVYAITGITGQIGGVIGRVLSLRDNRSVQSCAMLAKGQAWADRGCEVALATIEDVASLAAAFQGTEGVFVCEKLADYDLSPIQDAKDDHDHIRLSCRCSVPSHAIWS